MQKGMVTIVVPVYNVEKYLDCCVSSIVNQTYSDLEILLIDDGSPDKCPQMCDEWAARDSRIRVIHKQNEGLGMARNTGIENARGEFICFFDSDDYIAQDTIEKAVLTAEKEQAEVVVFGFTNVDDNGKVLDSFISPTGYAAYRNEQVREFFLPELISPDPDGRGTPLFYMSACMMLYSTMLIHKCDWRFASERDIIAEDVYSLLELFGYVQSVAVLPEAPYYYRVNTSSLSRSYLPGRYFHIKKFYHACMELCDKFGYSNKIRYHLSEPYLSFTRGAMKQEAAANLPRKKRMKNIEAILNDSTLMQVLKQRKTDRTSLSRGILFLAMKHRLHRICFLLLEAKNAAS